MFVPDYFVLLALLALAGIVVLVVLKMILLDAPRAAWRRLRKRP